MKVVPILYLTLAVALLSSCQTTHYQSPGAATAGQGATNAEAPSPRPSPRSTGWVGSPKELERGVERVCQAEPDESLNVGSLYSRVNAQGEVEYRAQLQAYDALSSNEIPFAVGLTSSELAKKDAKLKVHGYSIYQQGQTRVGEQIYQHAIWGAPE